MMRVTVNSKNQIVLPAEVREELEIKPGDNLIPYLRKHSVLFIREPESHTDALQGLGKEVWANVDVDEWLQNERDSWNR